MKAGNGEFLTEAASFVQDYNWEVTHKLEGKGFLVATSDLDALVTLVQSHGAELVGSLLLAYGYASAPSTAKDTSDVS